MRVSLQTITKNNCRPNPPQRDSVTKLHLVGIDSRKEKRQEEGRCMKRIEKNRNKACNCEFKKSNHLPHRSNEGCGSEMSPGSNTESYPAFARIGLRENPGKNLNQRMQKFHGIPSEIVNKAKEAEAFKSRRLRWAGHVARMGESRNAYRVLVGRPEGKRPLGRPRRRWEDNIKMDLREVGYDDRDWINLAQDRDRWRAYVRAAMNLRVP
ncbi:hypothetical protein ANN_13103 [Periplaneta americana]|uniref:Uncharacterized protein n=1 Tax=Periplaneta americana TaxID=6978 RepID=A0ABQ8TKA6_PERAM|nr:hypothetical protein ANN_13103 [Periplaneta americana]